MIRKEKISKHKKAHSKSSFFGGGSWKDFWLDSWLGVTKWLDVLVAKVK
jgi:hypothetical protein